MESENGGRVVSPTLARFFLCIGGVFGVHRLYIDQVFESLIYFSTFGVFFLGPVYDVFYLNRLVQNYNDEQRYLKEESEGQK